MKTGGAKVYRILIQITAWVIFVFIPSGQTQFKDVRGILVPEGYKIDTVNAAFRFDKPRNDTITYKSLIKVKDDFNIINGCGNYNANQSNIKTTRGIDGNYLCVWEEWRSGYIEIQAQLFGANDEKIGEVIEVSDQITFWNSQPNITYNTVTNEYIVCWAGNGYNILVQRISNIGIKTGHNLDVTQFSCTNTNNPSAAVDKYGNILIAWNSDEGFFGNHIPYHRLLDKNLNFITEQTKTSYSPYNRINSEGWDRRCAADTLGHFFITWGCFFNNASQIVIQEISSSGTILHDPILIKDTTVSAGAIFPTITASKDGYFFIIWSSDRSLVGRIYRPETGELFPQITLFASNYSWYTYSASSGEHNFYVTLTPDSTYTMIISKDGTASANIKSQPVLSKVFFPYYPNLTDAENGSIYCSYYGYKKNDQDVIIQKFDTLFNAIGEPQKIGAKTCSAFQTNPVVKFNQHGRSLIVWTDRRDGTDNLYAQVLDLDYKPIGNNFLVNDTSNAYVTSSPYIVTDAEGNFILCYLGGSYSSKNLILQKISEEGQKIDSAVKAVSTFDYGINYTAQLDKDENLSIYWKYPSNTQLSVYTQKFNKNLKPVNQATNIFGNNSSAKYYLDMSANKSSNLLIVWSDFDTQNNSPGNVIKGKIITLQGKAVTDTFTVDTLLPGRTYHKLICKLDDENNAALEWVDYNLWGGDVKVHLQRRYYNDKDFKVYTNSYDEGDVYTFMHLLYFGNKKLWGSWADETGTVNSVYLNDLNNTYSAIHLQEIEPMYDLFGQPYNAYSTAINHDTLLFVYESLAEIEKGYDIHANVQQLDKTIYETETLTDSLEYLYSPYPNPATTDVTFKFFVNNRMNIKVTVFNILGQKVADLQDGVLDSGLYLRKINTTALASGVYIIKFSGEKEYLKKFLIIK